jgi:hypothetical protein
VALRHSYTATGTNDGTKQVSVDRWNADHAFDEDGALIPAITGAHPVPTGTNGILFFRSMGGRIMPAFVGPSGVDSLLQPHMARNGWAQWKPAGNSTTISAIGAAALTATGTATTANYATTSLHTQCTRVDYLVTTAATSAVAGFRGAINAYTGTLGYQMMFRFAPATGTTVSTQRLFVGMTSSTGAPTDVQPSTLVTMVGLGYDAADTNWQFMVNDGSGTATKVDVGVARPTTDRPGPYAIVVFCPPGGASIGVTFVDEPNDNSYSTTFTTNLPSAATALSPRGYHSVGGTSSIVGMTLFSGYMETDN